MRCPHDTEFWQRYVECGDPEAARHLQSCAACRAEAEHATRVAETLAHLPVLEAPASITMRFQALVQATTGRQFTCAEALSVLEAWREGDLDATQALLMEDHLLWCDSCAEAFAQAEQLTRTLRTIPVLTPPAVIGERLAAARIPWWQHMLQPVQPSWGRLAPAAAGFCAAAVLLLACILRTPVAPQVATVRIPCTTAVVAPGIASPKSMLTLPGQQPVAVNPKGPLQLATLVPDTPRNLPPGPTYRHSAAGANSSGLEQPGALPTSGFANAPRRIVPPSYSGPGGLVPDMDATPGPNNVHTVADSTPSAIEPAAYSSYETIEHQARSQQLAMAENTTFDSADLAASSPAQTATPEGLTPRPMRPIDLPKTDNPNAEINKMISAPRVPFTPAPVTCTSGEMHADSSNHVVQLLKSNL